MTTKTAAIHHRIIRECGRDRPRSDTASVLELPAGKLLCAYHSYSAGPDGGGDFGAARIYVQESADGGLTWENERPLVDVDPDNLNVMNPSLTLVGDRVLLEYVINHERTVSSTLIRWSNDGGDTFSDPVPIWERIKEHRFCGYDGFVHLGGGKLLLPFQTSKEVWTPGEHYTIGTMVSEDGGTSWREQPGRITLPMRGAMEPSIARFDDGRLVMSMRSQLGSVFMADSEDDGRTWSLPQTTGLKSPESCTCLRRIPATKSLVLFWNDSDYLPDHHHFGQRSPLSAARSDDGGKSWTRLFDVEDSEWFEYTNLSCTFTREGKAILTYLESEGTPDGRFGRSCMRLKATVIDVEALKA